MSRFLSTLVALLAYASAWANPVAINRASTGVATGSSVYSGSLPSQFSDGNDGNRDGQYFSRLSVFHSQVPESSPPSFWEVDLGATYSLDRLMIWPRTDVAQNTVENFRIIVRDAANGVVWQRDFLPTAAVNSPWATSALRGVLGRRVRIERLDQNPNFLTFAEFEVWGGPQAGAVNLALNKPVTASPAGLSTSAARGNDGILDGAYTLPGNPIYQSAATGTGQFWQVDLGADQPLDYVILYNRTDAATTTGLRLSVRNAAGAEVYAVTLADISRGVIVNGGAQFDLTHDIPGAVTGRFVRIETTLNQALAFTELEVFGPIADTLAPTITSTDPAAGTLVAELFLAEVAFNEDVVGVNAGDLLVNGNAATGVTVLSTRRYAFTFPQPANGVISFTWAAPHGIVDLAGNAFRGAEWSVILDATLPAPQPIISEFMADNAGGLRDADGDSSDWIEIYNPGSTAVNLNGWFLTDSAVVLNKWRMPATVLQAGQRLVVFASGKNRTMSGTELHTNFKLKQEGGYVALVKPDGATVASAWAYPNQRANASYGLGRLLNTTPLVAAGAAVKWLVPSASVSGWEARAFNDAGWAAGTTGLGFDQNSGGGGLLGYWNFNDASNPASAADSSGNARAGTLTNAAFTANTGGRTGTAGDRAMNFAGSGVMSVAAARTGAFDNTAAHDAVTLSLWTYGAGIQPQPDFLFYAGGNADGSGARVLGAHVPWSDQVIYWDTANCCDPSLHRVFVGDANAAHWRGQWNHYAFIKRGDTKEIWQNGTLILSGRNTADLGPMRSLFLGGTAGGGNRYDGKVDDFAIWDTALSPAEISALAAGGSPLAARRLTPLIATDIGAAMRNVNASVLARLHFVVANPAGLDQLILRMRYDDGFVAYLNGIEVARRNAPTMPSFNSAASSARPGGAALTVEEMDLSKFAALLVAGDNVLAVYGLNASVNDAEFLLLPELLAGSALPGRFFTTPTPGTANGAGYAGFIGDTSFNPNRGFYGTPQTVAITCATPGATIAYTTDSTDPSPTNGTRGASPAIVNITGTTVLRATAFMADLAPANVDTQTYLFVDQVAAQTRPAGVGATWPGGQPADFEMDARVYSGALSGFTVRDGLLAIPTLCVTVAPDGLWGVENGIYPNSGGRGAYYERKASAEYLVPGQPAGGFHTRSGIRVHGNISRDKRFTPKHSFSLFFRGDYGDAKLNYDLFGGGVAKFDELILRGGSTDTWACVEWGQFGLGPGGASAFRWLRPWASFVRDQWARDAGIAMGQPQARGRYVHLYLNGVYWGLYNLTEHPDDDFCADTIGGKSGDWDTLKDFAEIDSGDLTVWNQLISLAGGGLATDAQYQRLLGRNADGTLNASYNVLLNEPSLIDYMILHVFIGADDWPNHNWWAGLRSRGTVTNEGFQFFAWDQEISNENADYSRTSWGYVYQDVNAENTPTQVYFAARSNAEFRLHQHLFNGGVLSPGAIVARWNALTAQIDKAIVAESARWGDYQRPAQPYTREAEWLAHLGYMSGTYWPQIPAKALARFAAAGLWPTTQPPQFSQFGGAVMLASQLSITNPNDTGTIYYTTDGSDPRLLGGTIAPTAQIYSAVLTFTDSRTVRARVRSAGGEWSALTAAFFSYNPDSDGDGMTDSWELAHGLNVGVNDAALDADGDGGTNLFEFLSGTNPDDRASLFRIAAIVDNDVGIALTCAVQGGYSYDVQRCVDLAAGNWTVVATWPSVPATASVEFSEIPRGGRAFYRVVGNKGTGH